MKKQKPAPTQSQLVRFRRLILATVIVNGAAALLSVLTVLDVFVPLPYSMGRFSEIWSIGGFVARAGSFVVAIVFLVKKSKIHFPRKGLSAIGLLPVFALGTFVLVAIVYVITLFFFRLLPWGGLIIESVEASLFDVFALGLHIMFCSAASAVGVRHYKK